MRSATWGDDGEVVRDVDGGHVEAVITALKARSTSIWW